MKNEPDLWEGNTRCHVCNKWMKKEIMLVDGLKMRSWKCDKCGEIILHPVDAERGLLMNKLRRQAAEVTVGELREAPYIRFPKEMSVLIHKGDTAKITSKKKDEYTVEIVHSSDNQNL